MTGDPIRIRFLASLTADRRRVYSKQSRGQPVHAGTHIRTREIVLDSDLVGHTKEMARILTHEVFHFTWVRLGNRNRKLYGEMIRREFAEGARGELGWSAEWRKRLLRERSGDAYSGSLWREYLCESFCDTAAWMFAGIAKHDEFTLAQRYRSRRARWFQSMLSGSRIPI